VLLLALTVVLATVAAGAVLAVGDAPDGSPPRASLSLAVDGGTLSLTHHGGDTLVVDRLRLVVRVDGEPLAHQPPVPFFSARGFDAGPTGPFNSATDPQWTAGETATLRVAGTNRPQVATGEVVTVTVFVGETRVADLREPVG
jgi:FlaG/FlaF family flagellin (archaellin)